MGKALVQIKTSTFLVCVAVAVGSLLFFTPRNALVVERTQPVGSSYTIKLLPLPKGGFFALHPVNINGSYDKTIFYDSLYYPPGIYTNVRFSLKTPTLQLPPDAEHHFSSYSLSHIGDQRYVYQPKPNDAFVIALYQSAQDLPPESLEGKLQTEVRVEPIRNLLGKPIVKTFTLQ